MEQVRPLDVIFRELNLLRDLEAHLIRRRAMEPRHSREDHECPECETLAELVVVRRTELALLGLKDDHRPEGIVSGGKAGDEPGGGD